MKTTASLFLWAAILGLRAGGAAEDFPKPYSPPCTERENVFEFTEKPRCRDLGADKYEITFAVKGPCDATVGIIDEQGIVVRHLGAGVLGSNAPAPFQKNSLKQTIYWNGKDDLDEYPKEPGKLRVQVRLGLKPVFDKRLGGTSPKNLPGCVIGLAIGPEAAYVISRGNACAFGSATIRKFDRDGKYLCSLVPPPANLPEDQLGGMGFVDYELGKRALQGPDLASSVAVTAFYLPGYTLDGDTVLSCLPVVAGNRLIFANPGHIYSSPGSFLHYIYADGSTDTTGIKGLPMVKEKALHQNSRLALSPDGKTVYLSGVLNGTRGSSSCIYKRSLSGSEPAAAFAGEFGKPGSDNAHFNNAQGIDCDAEGRVYVADTANNRIQVFSPEGKYLKTISLDRPDLVFVHKKTGALYVRHTARVQGASVGRMTKLASFADPREECHADGFMGLMALDSWSERPRLWFSGMQGNAAGHSESVAMTFTGSGSVTIWEERDRKFEKIEDFEAAAAQEAGAGWFGRWNGVGTHVLGFANATCDSVRDKMYCKNTEIFDLPTGKFEGRLRVNSNSTDVAFDKHGFMHGHQDWRDSRGPCIWRIDPAQAVRKTERSGAFWEYPECPYDYGEELAGWKGSLRTRCQPCIKGFQDGFGVNMQGDMAVESNISYVPKMGDMGKEFALAGAKALTESGRYTEEGGKEAQFLRDVAEAEKKGEQTFFIRRQPGIPLTGATVWRFDRRGELKSEDPVVPGGLLNGVQIDEAGLIYFTMDHTRQAGGRIFLEGQGGNFGDPGAKKKTNLFTGTYVKTKPERFKLLLKNAPIPMDEPPNRAPDVTQGEAWVEGADWLYAGASPIVSKLCSCWSSRFHLDWYMRSYVPENYRHSIGVLDANGNLIMHIGRYANFDSAPGGKDGCKPGSEDIGFTAARYLGGTDNYLAVPDYGERIVVLKLNYHAEEIAPIKMK